MKMSRWCLQIQLVRDRSRPCSATSESLVVIVWRASRGQSRGSTTDGRPYTGELSTVAERTEAHLAWPIPVSQALWPEVPISDRCVGYGKHNALDDEGSRQIENAQNYDEVYHIATIIS